MADSFISCVEEWLCRLYIAAEGAHLRLEDRRKAVEVAAMLVEVEMAVRRLSHRSELVLVDAAAGKSYVGLLAAKLILEPMKVAARVIAIEMDPRRVEMSLRASERLNTTVPIECRSSDVGDPRAWPQRPAIVTALHACGPAADAIIQRAVECRAKVLLLVPCCTSDSMIAAAHAREMAERLRFPHHGPVLRRFIQAAVDAERTLRLEAAGYQTEVVELTGATVTPHNLLWRSRRVCEPVRMAAARKDLQTFNG